MDTDKIKNQLGHRDRKL